MLDTAVSDEERIEIDAAVTTDWLTSEDEIPATDEASVDVVVESDETSVDVVVESDDT